MRVVMLANNSCLFDARIRREAEALADAGHSVTVLATKADGVADQETVGGVAYHRLFKVREIEKSIALEASGTKHRSMGARFKALAFQTARWLITPSLRHLIGFARAYRKTIATLDPDVVHAHDLDTLLAGWLGGKASGAKLVYDAHELETDRNLPMVGFEKTYRAMAERFLIRRADAVITVSDSIADYLAERYKIDRPTLVLNAPVSDMVEDGHDDTDLRGDLRLANEVPLALYIGGLMPGRGVDQAVRSLSHLPDVHLAILGPRQKETEEAIIVLARALGVYQRLHLLDPVHHKRLKRYIARADISLVLIQDICLSYRFSFPNKLLQSLLAGLPVVGSRGVEIERLLTSTGAGLVIDETDPEAIAGAIARILAAPERYRPGPARIASLEASHGWSAQRKRLLECYDRLRHTRRERLGTTVAPQQ